MSPPAQPLSVVLADEHNLVRAGLARLLQSQGIHILGEASSAEQTLEVVSKSRPGLVMVSLTLGLELIHSLRQIRPDLPLLVLAPNYSQLALHSALRAGANMLLSKNHDIHQVLQAVHILAQQTRPHLHLQRRKEKFISLRQLRILKALTSGHTNEQIARRLNFSRSTIKAELRQLFETFSTQDRGQLISQAAHHGLIGAST
ncbi:hypothetical protein ABS71_01640 [bacterium SCN 62-11]|nr:MAG: hypothetical protein ABS71_01640 [bacterium SCN 62-11]